MCSNTIPSLGTKVSLPERAGLDSLCDVDTQREQLLPGHGIAAMSKVTLSGRSVSVACKLRSATAGWGEADTGWIILHGMAGLGLCGQGLCLKSALNPALLE